MSLGPNYWGCTESVRSTSNVEYMQQTMRQRSSLRTNRMRKSTRKNVIMSSPPSSPSGGYNVVTPIARGGVACPFPWKLHEMLDSVQTNQMEDIVSWDSKGAAFSVNDVPAFVKSILPQFFSQSKYASFQRQLNLYGFSRKRCNKYSAYYHKFFIRGQPDLVRNMTRSKVKGTGRKRVDPQPCTPPSYAAPASVTPRPDETMKVEAGSSDFWYEKNHGLHVDNDPLSLDGISAMNIQDGDLLFFEGSPFHFLETETFEGSPTTVAAAMPIPMLSLSSYPTKTRLAPRKNAAPVLCSDFTDFVL